jgi:ribosome biogenesis protein Tsr3
LIRYKNLCRRWGRNKNRELKKFVNKLTTDIRLRDFALRGRKCSGLLESCWRNQTKLCYVTKLLKNRHRAFPPLQSGNPVCVRNLEKFNLVANAFSNVYQSHAFNVSTAESKVVGTLIDIIRNSVA